MKIQHSLTELKASYGWVRQFLNHQQLSICSNTVSQKLPEGYEEKLITFQKCVISVRNKLSFSSWKHCSDSNMV
jgi:hypothetical protein